MIQDVIGILGPGAIGHMLAYFFQGMEGVSIQMRGRSGLVTQTRPVFLHDKKYSLALQTEGPLATYWFCCLKSHALQDGLRNLMKDLAPSSQIIILSNGYIEPLLQDLRREFPLIYLRKGLVVRGVKSFEDGYSIGPKGQVIWGDERPMTALELRIMQSLSSQGFQWNAQCCRLRREKWFFNTCLNTLCGVHRLPRNGAAIDQYRDELEALAYEVLSLAQELWPDWQPVHKELWQNLLRLIASTAENENSMAADVRLGRKTESAVLSGLVRTSVAPDRYPLLRSFDQKLQDLSPD